MSSARIEPLMVLTSPPGAPALTCIEPLMAWLPVASLSWSASAVSAPEPCPARLFAALSLSWELIQPLRASVDRTAQARVQRQIACGGHHFHGYPQVV